MAMAPLSLVEINQEPIPALDLQVLVHAYIAQDQRLMMFDYDGTLTPIVNDPAAAIPTNQLLAVLAKLCSNPKNHVWLISGRSRTFLQNLFGDIRGLGLSAEHGSIVRRPDSKEWSNLAESMDMGWKTEAEKVFSRLCGEIEFSWIERKEVAIVWHYRNALDHDSCLAKAVEAKASFEGEHLKEWDVDVMLGKANLEVRPSFLNKGSTAANLIKEVFGSSKKGFILCAGDDTTDEDMFRAILTSKLEKAGVFPVLVSDLVSCSIRTSMASFRVSSPHHLVDAVAQLSEFAE